MPQKTANYVNEIITAWPTIRAMARQLNVNDQLIHQWIKRRSIPKGFWREVTHAYNSRVRTVNALTVENLAAIEHDRRMEKATMQ